MNGIGTPLRVRLWDLGLQAVRAALRERGCREVTTPVRLREPIPEPYIEPVRAPPGYLSTSPEQGQKRLLAEGAGPIFEVAHVFRAGERGRLHREEFHLVEWYRPKVPLSTVMEDVEDLVERVFAAGAVVLEGGGARPGGEVSGPAPPARPYPRISVLDGISERLGRLLRGDETAEELVEMARQRGGDLWGQVTAALGPLGGRGALGGFHLRGGDRDLLHRARQLAAWSALLTWWWDAAEPMGAGVRGASGTRAVHIEGFPGALAALSRVVAESARSVARRFETVVGGVEVANGYEECTDPELLALRLRAAALLHEAGGTPLSGDPGELGRTMASIPPCCGAALGLDRLLMLAVGARSLDEISLHRGAAG